MTMSKKLDDTTRRIPPTIVVAKSFRGINQKEIFRLPRKTKVCLSLSPLDLFRSDGTLFIGEKAIATVSRQRRLIVNFSRFYTVVLYK